MRLRNLSKYRTGGGVSFHLVVPEMDIAPGERVALVGESGCGKSTLLDLLAMVLRVDEADVFFLTPPQQQTFNVLTLWRRRRLDALAALRGRYLGYVLQTGGLLGFMTVRDNINLTRRLLDLADDGTVEQLAERLDLTRYLGRYPAALSVGERQRVAIARALAHRPPIVIADEPTASLDPITADSVMDLFVELVQEQGATTIISSHDWARVERYGLSPIRAFLERDEQATGTVTATFRRVEAWA